MLTILTLITDNSPEIKDFFDSIAYLDAKIIAVNTGIAPETIDVCHQYGAEVVYYNYEESYSEALNLAVKQGPKGYYLYLNPWETLLSIDADQINQRAYNASIITNGLLIKEPRIWNKEAGIKFKNPVCQTLAEKTDHFCDCVIISKPESNIEKKLDLITKWQIKEPNNYDILYYRAACLLALGRYDEFLTMSDRYMRLNRKVAISSTMNKYYYAMVRAIIKNESKPAIQNLIQCLVANPLMAEFWCLLGDVYYQNKKYDLARDFYENAHLLGAFRLKHDKWPVDISKYQEYPQKMQKSCEDLIANRVIFKSV